MMPRQTQQAVRLLCPCVVILLLLAGCTPTTPVPEDHFYRLPQPRSEAGARPVFSGTLAIGRVRAGGLYNERPLLYVESGTPLEIRRYRYHLWQDTPAALIRAHLRTFLQAAGAADEVLPLDTDLQPDLQLDVRIKRFEQLLDNHGAQVVVGLVFTGRASGRQPWSREYLVTEQAKGESMQATVTAFGEALDTISAMLLRDAG